MDTVASSTLPADTPLGSVPKPSFTDSPSSSSASSVAAKVKVLLVWLAVKVTLAGTPL